MVLKKFEFFYKKRKIKLQVKECKSIFSKTLGLMFKRKSPSLLFIFSKEKNLAIHSFFCFPFIAVWLDKNRKVTKIEKIHKWKANIFGNGKFLVEIPLLKENKKITDIFTLFK